MPARIATAGPTRGGSGAGPGPERPRVESMVASAVETDRDLAKLSDIKYCRIFKCFKLYICISCFIMFYNLDSIK
jgi:hypothetical protein